VARWLQGTVAAHLKKTMADPILAIRQTAEAVRRKPAPIGHAIAELIGSRKTILPSGASNW
jgi:hypothetical protein